MARFQRNPSEPLFFHEGCGKMKKMRKEMEDMIEHKIRPGLITTYQKEATFDDAIPAGDSVGIMDYLVSTPALFRMVIEASSGLLDPLLPETFITVGKNAEITHESPSLTNSLITIKLMVTKVEDDRVFLEFTGHDSFGEICKGTCERVIVNREVLLEYAYKRASKEVTE